MSTDHVKVRFCPSPTGSPHVGLIRTALSDYRTIRSQLGLTTYAAPEMAALLAAAGFDAVEPLPNLGHNPHRMTFAGRKAG